MILNPALRAIAIVLLLLVLLLGAWGIIVVAMKIPSLFSHSPNLFSSSTVQTTPQSASNNSTVVRQETLSVSVPQNNVSSNTRFTISWTHVGYAAENYQYTVLYRCENGITIDAPMGTGAYKGVSCNTPFNYTKALSSMELFAHNTDRKEQFVTIEVAAVKISTGAVTAKGVATIAVAPNTTARPTASYNATTKGVATKASIPNSYTVPAQIGAPDLQVRIISSNQNSVQFSIENIGTRITPAGWTFRATLPMNPPYTYLSAPQISLAPGGYIINTLNFSSQGYGCPVYQNYPYYMNPQNCYSGFNGGLVSIVVDPSGIVPDFNRTNNVASINVY